MIRASLVLVSAAILLSFAPAVRAEGSENDFELVNQTGYTIDKVYVGPHDEKSWGEDILGKETLKNGETVKITFSPEADKTHYDVKVVYEDKEEAAWGNLELPKVNKLTIHWDKKSGESKAEVE